MFYFSQLEINSSERFLEKVFFAGEKSFNYSEISGSPYLDNSFQEVNVSVNFNNVLARYNVYSDEIEFKNGDRIFIVPKNYEFSRISFLINKNVFVLKEFEGKSRYFLVLDEKSNVYKRELIKFVPPKPAVSSYQSEKPATFEISKPSYFIEMNGVILEIPTNKSDLIVKFSKNNDNLRNFLKKENIKLSKEEDIIKLCSFIKNNQ